MAQVDSRADADAKAAAKVTTDAAESGILVLGSRTKSAILPGTSDAMGLGLAAVDTPRSVSTVSLQMMDQYSLNTIRDLTAVTPGVFTASFYGVDGSVNIRGEYADNYFHGFKRTENQGTYVTPIEGALNLEVVRGVASPVYGGGRAGGYVNFDPRGGGRADRFLDGQAAFGQVDLSAGTYNMFRGEVEYGTPFKLGDYDAGVDVYYEHNQAEQYFHGIKPKHNLVQGGLSSELPGGWTMHLGGQYYKATGMQGTTGVNRLTQDLVDHSTYVSGSFQQQLVSPGAKYITPANVDAAGGVTEYYATSNGYSALDPATIKEVKLSRRNIVTSSYDFGDAETSTGYLDLDHDVGPGVLKVQGFIDDLNADSFNSYGFAKSLRDQAKEFRVSLTGKAAPASWFALNYVTGFGYRDYHAKEKYNYARGYMVLDRQDISVGATADDIFNPVYAENGDWDQIYRSDVGDMGVFFSGSATLFDRLMITGGARYDAYHAKAENTGLLDYSVPLNTVYRDSQGVVSWSISASLKLPYGIEPYFTKGKSFAPETSQGGAVTPGDVEAETWLSPTKLTEGGIKASLFGDKLFIAASVYKQQRRQSELLSNNFTGATTKGYEGELRWAVDRHFGFSGVVTRQKTRVSGCNYLFVMPSQLGIADEDGWGVTYEASTCSYAGYENGYIDRTQPKWVLGAFANYETGSGFGATFGGNWIDRTSGELPGAVVFPSYFLLRGSAHYDFGRVRVSVNVNNVLNTRYYIPQRSTETEGAAMPGEGRTAVLKLTGRF